MTEEELSQLSTEEKMKVTQYLIADLAASFLSEDPAISDKARHNIGALAMTFNNFFDLISKANDSREIIVRKLHQKYRYSSSTDEKQG